MHGDRRQGWFNTIWAHAKAREKSEHLGPCRYRTPDGRKCFVGALIPDEDYRPEFDENSMFAEDIITEVTGVECSPKEAEFLRAVQGIHDGQHSMDWLTWLRVQAEKNGLTVPKEEER